MADHIELESIRLDRMDHIKYIGKSAATDHQDAQKLLDESANKVKDLTERIDGSFSPNYYSSGDICRYRNGFYFGS